MIRDTFTQAGERSLSSILWDVILFTVSIEAAGALLLLYRFLQEGRGSEAPYLAVFHAVSAFCNAGFALFSDSFIAYREDLVVNVAICFLIITGGIGFPVLSELKRQFGPDHRNWKRLSLHTKMALSTTFFLLVSSSALIIVMEWDNSLAPLSGPGRFLAGFFQAVSARTAGFNTLTVGSMANETLFLIILFMFVGASPGSCGGGIKTSTFASLLALGVSRFRGYERPRLFHRTISQESVGKAISVVMTSMFVVILGTMAMLMIELGDVSHPLSRGNFLDLLFEVISAFGTVGLSTGVTGGLSAGGKLVITIIMFIGRLGPLVVAVAVSRPRTVRFLYAEENIMIG